MKKVYIFFSVACLLVAIVCCSQPKNEEEKTERAIVETGEGTEIVTSGVQGMQHSLKEEFIDFKGQSYKSVVERQVDTTLPIVTDEQGTQFYDNTITVKLSDKNGRMVLNRVYKKDDFRGVLGNDRFLSKAILEGMVFYRTEPGGFLYSASVAYPQTDIFVPIRLLVSPSGTVSIQLDEEMVDIPERETEK